MCVYCQCWDILQSAVSGNKVMATVLFECQESIKSMFPALDPLKFKRAFFFFIEQGSLLVQFSFFCLQILVGFSWYQEHKYGKKDYSQAVSAPT